MVGARVGTSMTMMNVGKITRTSACCPVCGHEVDMRSSFNGRRLLQSFGCYRCGPTEYVVALA